MAKKKTTEVIESSAETEVVAPVETPETPTPETEEQAPEVITEQSVKEDMIPEYAKRVLRMYPNVKEMYISRNGGAFPAETKQSLVGNAILYQNPFYKS
jgi:hypothetical protein